MYIHANYDLKQHNTLHLPAKARYFVEIRHASSLQVLRQDPTLSSMPWRVIGGGSNLLIRGDLEQVVLHCTYDEIKLVKEDEELVWLSVGAGCRWHDLVTYTVNQGWWGLENLALIPGTVGAAPVQNIGAYGAEVRDTITRVQSFDLRSGERIELRNGECQFGYRTSIFKTELSERTLIHRVTFRLRKKPSPNLMYEPLKEALAEQDAASLTPRDIYQQIIALRNSRIPDPAVLGNAGSFFKNPSINAEHFLNLQTRWPDMPSHKSVDGNYKIPAAWLIETAGWKGRRDGQVGVHQKHALILVNYGEASGEQILAFAEQIRQDIIRIFAIALEMEVVVL